MPDYPLNIGAAAKAAGLSPKMVRYYENVGLIAPAVRTDAGYRNYSENDVRALLFIRQARDLGFSVKQIGELLDLWQDRQRASSRVKALASAHLTALDEKMAQLAAMKNALENLVRHCRGDHRPDCPILDGLALAAAQTGEVPDAEQPPQAKT